MISIMGKTAPMCADFAGYLRITPAASSLKSVAKTLPRLVTACKWGCRRTVGPLRSPACVMRCYMSLI